MTENSIFRGAATALITPLTADGVDYENFGRLIDWQIESGIDGLVICGTSGEGSTLSDKEHREALDFAIQRADGRVPMIAGTGSNDIAYGIDLTKFACEIGYDAVLVVTPYYNKATQNGLIKSYMATADASTKPCILYNVPSRTGVNIKPETAAELAKLPRVNGIKEASGDLDQVAKIHELCGDELNIWSGNDDQIFDILERGGKGVISVLSNIAPKETHEIVASYLNGDKKTSKELMDKYVKLAKAMFVDVNPIPVKEAVSLIGFNAGPLRLPLIEMDESNKKYVKETMEEYGLVK